MRASRNRRATSRARRQRSSRRSSPRISSRIRNRRSGTTQCVSPSAPCACVRAIWMVRKKRFVQPSCARPTTAGRCTALPESTGNGAMSVRRGPSKSSSHEHGLGTRPTSILSGSRSSERLCDAVRRRCRHTLFGFSSRRIGRNPARSLRERRKPPCARALSLHPDIQRSAGGLAIGRIMGVLGL